MKLPRQRGPENQGNDYSPLSIQAVALSSDGIVPNRTSSAATVRVSNNIATNASPAL
jgi:hypothetical protein